ncbi:MAG: SWIM zinc finger family protein [Dysgonamonadaceae bacterium]|nr:SWIM zinc finger family protein [Dysgonamonadaceae bacterium]
MEKITAKIMEISEKKIMEYALSAVVAKNGRAIAQKNKLFNLKISPDKTLLWGECAGSGKIPYSCSVDFIDEYRPVFRCTCPSRQLPCKHIIGLLYAFEMKHSFQINEIPENIIAKREKLKKHREKKNAEDETIKESPENLKKTNVVTFIKKIETQLNGIEIAEKLLKNLVHSGLSSVDAQISQSLQTNVKELGNYYISGIQTAFNDLLIELAAVKNGEYTGVINQVNYISALLKKSAGYLNKRKEEPDSKPELDSAIEEQIGYVWKLAELMQYGLWEENAEIMQLSFNTYDNQARKEWVDEGIWINLKTGKIYKTHNYRPYRAIRHIKAENTTFGLLKLKEMFIYPGNLNPRIRWLPEALQEKRYDNSNMSKIIHFAATDYAETIKSVKNVIKNPLTDKHPVVLLALHKVYLNGENPVIEDKDGNKLTLKDKDGANFSSTNQLKNFLPANPADLALAVMINNDVGTGLLSAQALSLITQEKIIRLLF